jgi:uncharacterized protein
MQLTEHKPGNHHSIRSVDLASIRVDDQHFHSSIIVGARLLQTNWPVASLADLTPQTLEPLFQHAPELVIIGIGASQQFPSQAIYRQFLQHQIGLECMNLTAACHTFNVLMSENRRALAALILSPNQ